MGVDDRHVQRVIQCKTKPLGNLDTFMQRFGRCARDPELQGLCVLYYEKDLAGKKATADGPKRTQKRTADGELKNSSNVEEKHGMLDPGLYQYININNLLMEPSSGTAPVPIQCRRKLILGYYADQEYHNPGIYTNKYCDLYETEEIQRSDLQLLQGDVFQKSKNTRLTNSPPE